MEHFNKIINTYPNKIEFWENLAAFNRLPKNQRLEIISRFWTEILIRQNDPHVFADYRWLPVYEDIYALVAEDHYLVKLFHSLAPTPLKTWIVEKLTTTNKELTYDLSKIENFEIKKKIIKYKKQGFPPDHWNFIYEFFSKKKNNKTFFPYNEKNEEKSIYKFFSSIYDNKDWSYAFDYYIEKHIDKCPQIFKYLLTYEPKKFERLIRETNTRIVFTRICTSFPEIDALYEKTIFNFEENSKQTINEMLEKCEIMSKISRKMKKRQTNAKKIIQEKINNWKFQNLNEFTIFFELLLKSDVKELNLDLNYEYATKQIFDLTDNPLFFVIDKKLFNLIYVFSQITENHIKKFVITSENPLKFLEELFSLNSQILLPSSAFCFELVEKINHSFFVENYNENTFFWFDEAMKKYPEKFEELCFDIIDNCI